MQEIKFPNVITKSQDPPHELFSTSCSSIAHQFYHPHIHLRLSEMNINYLHCNGRTQSSLTLLMQFLS